MRIDSYVILGSSYRLDCRRIILKLKLNYSSDKQFKFFQTIEWPFTSVLLGDDILGLVLSVVVNLVTDPGGDFD